MLKKATKLAQKDSGNPCVWICSKNDRGRKAIKNGKIYLGNNEKFELELLNPTNDKVLAMIYINSVPIAKNGILLDAKERLYVDYFVDSENKEEFIYKHYISNSNESDSIEITPQYIQAFFYTEIGDVLDLIKDLKENRKQKSPLEKFLEEESKKLPYTYPYPYPNTMQPTWIINPYQNIVGSNIGNYGSGTIISSGNLGIGTINPNSVLTVYPPNQYNNTIINGSSTNITTGYSDVVTTYTSDVHGKIEFEAPTEESSIEVSSGEKEMEFLDDHISMTLFEILPDIIKPTTSKDINNGKKEKDKIQKLLDLKVLLDNNLIDMDEFAKLKSEII